MKDKERKIEEIEDSHTGTHRVTQCVYYGEIKGEIQRILIYECRCHESKVKMRDLHVS
jgi:hypothetical protein